jgi:hypothetical protein
VLSCQFLVLAGNRSWFTYLCVLRVPYSCGVVSVLLVLAGNSFGTYVLHTVVVLCLFFWFWREIVFGVTYVLRVQYSCTVVFLKNDYLFSLF